MMKYSAETQYFQNILLPIAVHDGDFKKVEALLNEGVDVNIKSFKGNIPLHLAVKNDSLDIVRVLLQFKADLNIENDEIETALEVGSKLSNKDIVIELQENVLENSKKILDENGKFKAQNARNESPSSQQKIIDTKLEVCIGNEIAKKKIKIRKCLEYLEKVEIINTSEFTHKQLITFVFFLEAVAFQDIEESADTKKLLRSEIEDRFGKGKVETEVEIRKEIQIRRKEIKRNVMSHFKENYFPENFEDDQKRITKARNLLCHTPNKTFKTGDFAGKLNNPGTDIATFFKKLLDYVAYITNEMEDEPTTQSDCSESVDCKFLLQMLSDKDINDLEEPDNDVSKNKMESFIHKIYQKDQWTQEIEQEMMFDLLVNIFPAYENNIWDLDHLRNKIIHDFCKYNSIEQIIKIELSKTLYDLRSRIYKFYYAKKIFEILHQITAGEDYKEIDTQLKEALKKFQKDFEDSCNSFSDLAITAEKEVVNLPEYQLIRPNVFPDSESEAIPKLVSNYMKFMLIFDYEEVEDETVEEDAGHLRDLSHAKRREIYEKFITLNQMQVSFPDQYNEMKKEFKADLTNQYGVKGEYFEEACLLYIENGSSSIQTSGNEETIINTICVLRKLQTLYCIFSNNDLLTFVSRVIDGKEIFDMKQIKDWLKNPGVPEIQKRNFKKDIGLLNIGKFLDIELNNNKLKVSTIKIVNNILGIFYNQYNSYKIKFNNIEDAFNDNTFLECLIKLEKQFKMDLSAALKLYKEKHRDNILHESTVYYSFTSVILRKLLNIGYAIPYIVRMITEDSIMLDNKINVITEAEITNVLKKEDIEKLTELLIDRHDYVDHLSVILKKIKFQGLDLYEMVLKKIRDINPETLNILFEEPVHVQNIMALLIKSTNEHRDTLASKIIRLLNANVYRLYRTGKYENALEILNYYFEKFSASCKLERLEAKRLMAKIFNRQGESKNDSNDAKKEHHEKAIQLFTEIEETMDEMQDRSFEENVTYFLTLSHIAYTYSLLKEHKKAYNLNRNLYQKVKNFVLTSESEISTKQSVGSNNNLFELSKLKLHCDLIAFSDETKRYLNIMKIQESVAYNCWWIARNGTVQNDRLRNYTEALAIYQEVYHNRRKEQNMTHLMITKKMRVISMVNIDLAKEKEKKIEEQSLQHSIEALHLLNRAYYILKGERDHSYASKFVNDISINYGKIKYKLDRYKSLKRKI